MAITNYPFGELTGLAGVERFLLQRQERQLLADTREHMGDGWYLYAPPDKPARPKPEKQAESVAETDAKPQDESENNEGQ